MRYVCPVCDRSYETDLKTCPEDGSDLIPFEDVANLEGRVLDDRFEIQKKLGEGGMGAVYRARQRSVDRLVAIKVLRPEHQNDLSVVKRFFLEAKAASRLTNPHTITVYDFGKTREGLLYIAMEFLQGRSLRDKLTEQPVLPLAEVVRILDEMGQSLAEAHAQGIIHRDLKPENVFLVESGGQSEFVKVLDFGIAKARALSDSTMTRTGAIQGTPTYMCPEVVTGESADARADVYAMGIMMYEMLTGVAPFRAETPIQLMMQHAQAAVPPVGEVNPEVFLPQAVVDFLWRCLAKRKEARPMDAGAFRQELSAALRDTASGTSKKIGPLLTTGTGFRGSAETISSLAGKDLPGATPVPGGGDLEDSVGVLDLGLQPEAGTGRKVWWFVGGGTALLAALAVVLGLALGGGGNAPRGEAAPAQAAQAMPQAPAVAGGTAPGASSTPEAARPAAGGATGDAPVTAAPAVVQPPAPEKAPAPQPVTLTLVSDPAGAEVWLGGERVGLAPIQTRVPRSSSAAEVIMRRAGFVEDRSSVVPDQDRLVSRTLSPVPPPPEEKKPAPAVIRKPGALPAKPGVKPVAPVKPKVKDQDLFD
jgi:serine/threonine-protein kinase